MWQINGIFIYLFILSSEVLSDERNVDVDIITVEGTEENTGANTDSSPVTPSSESSFQGNSSDLSSSRSFTVKERRDRLWQHYHYGLQ